MDEVISDARLLRQRFGTLPRNDGCTLFFDVVAVTYFIESPWTRESCLELFLRVSFTS